jgi:hypothetical protein
MKKILRCLLFCFNCIFFINTEQTELSPYEKKVSSVKVEVEDEQRNSILKSVPKTAASILKNSTPLINKFIDLSDIYLLGSVVPAVGVFTMLSVIEKLLDILRNAPKKKKTKTPWHKLWLTGAMLMIKPDYNFHDLWKTNIVTESHNDLMKRIQDDLKHHKKYFPDNYKELFGGKSIKEVEEYNINNYDKQLGIEG